MLKIIKIYLIVFSIIFPITFFVFPALALTPARTVCQQGEDPKEYWCENFPGTVPPKNCIGPNKYYNPEIRDCSGSEREEKTANASDGISLDIYFIYGAVFVILIGVIFYILARIRNKNRN